MPDWTSTTMIVEFQSPDTVKMAKCTLELCGYSVKISEERRGIDVVYVVEYKRDDLH